MERSGTSSQATKGSDFIRRRSASYGGTSKQGVTAIEWRAAVAAWRCEVEPDGSVKWSLAASCFFAFEKRQKKWWDIYNQIRTHSPFCKRLISSSLHVIHKIKWRILQFLREVFQQFRWHADSNRSIIMQWLNFCHTGGCKNSFTLKMAPRSTFFNMAPQPGKTNPACKFLSNAKQTLCPGVLCRVFPEFGYKYPWGKNTPHFPL